jgi:hypothetical protein
MTPLGGVAIATLVLFVSVGSPQTIRVGGEVLRMSMFWPMIRTMAAHPLLLFSHLFNANQKSAHHLQPPVQAS